MANIFRVIKDKNYSIVSNDYIRDKNLKLESIGLLTIVLSLPPDFKVTMNSLMSVTNKNYRSIKNILNDLKDNGYLIVNKQRDEKGYFFFDYIFFESKRLNPLYTFYPVDNSNQPVENASQTNYPLPTNEPVVEDDDYINTINYNKIDIDINKLNLCFLTEYIVEWDFIKINDINLFGYNDYLTKLLKENKDDSKLVIKVVAYVVKRIKSNKYLDEEGDKILNLLTYFIGSVNNNLQMLRNRENINLWDFDEDIY